MKTATLSRSTVDLINEIDDLLNGLCEGYDLDQHIPATLRGLDVMECKRKRCRITGDYYRVQLWDGRVFRTKTLMEARVAIQNANR